MSWRSRQQALTLICTVKAEAGAALPAELERSRELLLQAFRGLMTLHWARLLVLPAGAGGSELVLEFAYDGSLEEFAGALWARAGGALGRVLEHCDVPSPPRDSASFQRFAVEHSIRAEAAYTAHEGLSVTRIRNDAALDRLLQLELDRSRAPETVAELGPFEIARSLQIHAHADPALRFERVERPREVRDLRAPLRGRYLELVAAVWLLALLELGQALRALGRPRPAAGPSVESSAASGTLGALAQILEIKPGKLRLFLLRLALWLLHGWLRQRPVSEGYALEQVHGLRWLILPGHRLLCLAHVDVAPAALLARLGRRERRALSLVWLQTVGFPSGIRRLLVGAGAEALLRQWLDQSLVSTPIWFSAYPTLAALEIEKNHRVRELLSGELDQERASELCALL
jgi:hypothetical protein